MEFEGARNVFGGARERDWGARRVEAVDGGGRRVVDGFGGAFAVDLIEKEGRRGIVEGAASCAVGFPLGIGGGSIDCFSGVALFLLLERSGEGRSDLVGKVLWFLEAPVIAAGICLSLVRSSSPSSLRSDDLFSFVYVPFPSSSSSIENVGIDPLLAVVEVLTL